MVSNSLLQPIDARGWRSGLSNLLRLEFGRWWRTSRWWLMSLVWIALIDGMIMVAGVTLANAPDVELGPNEGMQMFGLMGLAATIGAIIVMQNVIVGEKESGVAGWLLSKPVSRSAYVLSKFVSNAVGILVTAVLVPGIIAYLLISQLFAGTWLSPVDVLAGLGVLSLDVLFFVSATLMLGTFFDQRGVVLAVPLGFVFLQQPLLGLVPALFTVAPYTLSSVLAGRLAFGEPLPFVMPIVATGLWIVLFVGAAIWRFGCEEF